MDTDTFRGPELASTARRGMLVVLLVLSTLVISTPDILSSLIYGFATVWVLVVLARIVVRQYSPT